MLLVYSKSKFSLLFIFFLYFLVEVCMGGSGALFSVGPLTLRKINFCIALVITVPIFFLRKEINKDVLYITIIFLIFLLFSTCVGLVNYGTNDKVFENFFMQSFFLGLPFYSFFINNNKDVRIIVAILKFSALFLAVAYLVIIIIIFLGIIPLNTFLGLLPQSDDFTARGDSGILYKGFIYMCVGIYFWSLEKRKFKL